MEDVFVVIFTVLLIVLVMLVIWAPSVIAILKRHYVLGAVGLLLFAPVGWVGALLLAKPESWWARNRYDDAKRAEAIAKHGDPAAAGRPAGACARHARCARCDGRGRWCCRPSGHC